MLQQQVEQQTNAYGYQIVFQEGERECVTIITY